MKIIRVFPHKNSCIPQDAMVRIGCQTLALPEHDEIHISCTFTWDMDYCEWLKEQYEGVTDKPVLLGGVAYGSPVGDFVPGLYIRKGFVFTSRGCNNRCSFCFVHDREGPLRELPVQPGHIIQDNNFLQTSQQHQQKVFDMLQTQRQIEFRGGLEARQITPWFCEQVTKLQQHYRLKALWFAVDHEAEFKPFANAMEMLRDAGFKANTETIYVYTLSYGKDLKADEERMSAVFRAGGMPRCQLYREATRKKTEYPPEIERWARQWQRPAITRRMLKGRC